MEGPGLKGSGPFFCVPSMVGSLGVKVPYPS
jgi:hypothetical protein